MKATAIITFNPDEVIENHLANTVENWYELSDSEQANLIAGNNDNLEHIIEKEFGWLESSGITIKELKLEDNDNDESK